MLEAENAFRVVVQRLETFYLQATVLASKPHGKVTKSANAPTHCDHIGLFVSHTQNATQTCEKSMGISGLICARVVSPTPEQMK